MDSLQMLFVMLKRLSLLVDWLIIASLHLGLFCGLLAWLWATGATAPALQESFWSLVQSRNAAVLGLLGVSVPTALGAYLWALQRGVRKLTTLYVWRPIHEQVQEDSRRA